MPPGQPAPGAEPAAPVVLLVEDNADTGIFHEISYHAVIRHNTVRRNGFENPRWGYGAGILVAGSPNVTIHDNTVTGNARGIIGIQQDRGSGDHGPYELENLNVHNNTITMTTGWTGLLQDVSDRTYFTHRNNRFQTNHYFLDSLSSDRFHWKDEPLTASDWLELGQDVDGEFARATTHAAASLLVRFPPRDRASETFLQPDLRGPSEPFARPRGVQPAARLPVRLGRVPDDLTVVPDKPADQGSEVGDSDLLT